MFRGYHSPVRKIGQENENPRISGVNLVFDCELLDDGLAVSQTGKFRPELALQTRKAIVRGDAARSGAAMNLICYVGRARRQDSALKRLGNAQSRLHLELSVIPHPH